MAQPASGQLTAHLMVLNDSSLNTAPRQVDSRPLGVPVIGSDALREAALRASWHRDHRVARRRQSWRWVLFWVWKIGYGAVVVTGPIMLIAAVALQFELIPRYGQWVASPALTSNPGPIQAVGRTLAVPNALSTTHELELKRATSLAHQASSPTAWPTQAVARASPSADTPSAASAGTAPQPVQLKSEHQLFLKESSP